MNSGVEEDRLPWCGAVITLLDKGDTLSQQVAFGEGLDVPREQEADVPVLQSEHHRVVVGIRACPG